MPRTAAFGPGVEKVGPKLEGPVGAVGAGPTEMAEGISPPDETRIDLSL